MRTRAHVCASDVMAVDARARRARVLTVPGGSLGGGYPDVLLVLTASCGQTSARTGVYTQEALATFLRGCTAKEHLLDRTVLYGVAWHVCAVRACVYGCESALVN